MTDTSPVKGFDRLLAIRVGIGLAQGVALYLLDKLGEHLPATLLGALVLFVTLAPIAALGAIGACRARTAAIWLGVASAALLALGGYEGWVFALEKAGEWPRFRVVAFLGAALFVAHHLILPADAERRRTASYSRYFDEGWKDGVRLVLGLAFVGALWILLFLGAALFDLIGLKFLSDLIREEWFAFPATTTFFALAIHVTATRGSLVLGARTLALNLMSWLLPLMTLIVGGFLAGLAFTGFSPLWETGHAGGILLAATGALIVLINAAYQDGERGDHPPRPLRWAVRVAAVLLAPLALVTAYGLWLRIAQHGLTPGRIYALACLLMAGIYASGYLWAAVDRRGWMRRLEVVNIAAAHVVVLVLLAVFSPLADPARLSVSDQVSRLRTGEAEAAAFDYRFLRFGGGRWGREALARLSSSANPMIRERAREAARLKSRHEPIGSRTPEVRRQAFEVLGDAIPQDFLTQSWGEYDEPTIGCVGSCPVLVRDMDGDGAQEVVVLRPYNSVVYQRTEGRGWQRAGELRGAWCSGDLDAVRARRFTVRPPRSLALEIEGREFVFTPDQKCDSRRRAAALEDEQVDVAIVKPGQ
ncbi:DUF4153 domain-containing protein [Phenylobacterium sp. VNQ135]|uniref:DUF4153 domain-containing protein n=1 Tax=Phenylobacterium sp. VNQ135 TaxID=3400922 RepID=UPI003BFBB05C